MKEKMMTTEGLMQFNPAKSGYENALSLLATQHWEDALACLVLDAPSEKTVGWVLQKIINAPVGLNETAQSCASDISQWLSGHDDDLRWRIFHQAEALGFDTPLGALGLSLFWTQGSMTPAEFEAVYPEPHLAPLMLHCALKLLSVSLAGEHPPHIGAQTLLSDWNTIRGVH